MADFRIFKRGVLFKADGDLLVRTEFGDTEAGSVAQAGNPVPVVFGTRFVAPVVIAWSSLGRRVSRYYNPTADQGLGYAPTGGRTERMITLTMRMVLCAGRADALLGWTAGGIPFIPHQVALPATGSLAVPNTYNFGDKEADRWVISAGDADLFGGGESGGLGYPYSRGTYDSFTKFTEFWYSSISSPVNLSLDQGVIYRGLSTLYFDEFNFGGRVPPAGWRVAVTRLDYLTSGGGTFYTRQWQPGLATIRTLPASRGRTYYLVVLSTALPATQRTTIWHSLLTLPYDSETRYQIVSYPNPLARTTLLRRTQFRAELDAYIRTDAPYPFTTDSPNFTDQIAQTIVNTYAETVAQNLTTGIPEQGIVLITGSDVFAHTRGTELNNLNVARQRLLYLQYPPSSLPNPNPFGSNLTERELSAIRQYQPEVRLVLFSYYIASSNSNATNPYTYNETVIGTDNYQRWLRIDSHRRPIIIGGRPGIPTIGTDVFHQQFRNALPFGRTMNPIHALREAITDSQWGRGTPADKVDDNAFYQAALTCHTEKLDWCFVLTGLDVKPMIKQIVDYVNGVLYYEPASDKVTIKLIRNDYSLGDIQSFDESSISMIKGYKRQQANRNINAVSVKYHDPVLDSAETLTIHDLEGAEQTGGVKVAALTFDGCATREAAARVASRELSGLSQSIISLTAKLNPTRPLGLGDPIIISYRDLGLARVVMRVASIDYGNGLTGGVDVDLLQDVFADPYYSELVGDLPIILDNPARLPDLHETIAFLELSREDLTLSGVTTPFASPNQSARYFKLGRRSSPLDDATSTVSYNGAGVPVSIGRLLTDIFPLSDDPANESFTFDVAIPWTSGVDTHVRVDDEIFAVLNVTETADNVYRVEVRGRAEYDTVAVSHVVGADVWFLTSMSVNTTPWDGSSVVVNQTKGTLSDRELLLPGITFITRGSLPIPPEWETVAGSYTPNVQIDGDIVLRFKPRIPTGVTTTFQTLIVLKDGDTIVHRQLVNTLAPTRGVYPVQSVTITTADVGLTGQHDLTLTVGSMSSVDSWQSWEYSLDWSSTTRERTGWTYNFGNNWGHGPRGSISPSPNLSLGWDYNWDQDYDD